MSFFEKNKARGNGFTIPKRNSVPNLTNTPGPGKYEQTSVDFTNSKNKGVSLARS